MTTTGGTVAIMALLRLMVLLGHRQHRVFADFAKTGLLGRLEGGYKAKAAVVTSRSLGLTLITLGVILSAGIGVEAFGLGE